jgi:hypothetical protein
MSLSIAAFVICAAIVYIKWEKKNEKTASAQYFDAPPNSSKKMCNKMVSLRERLSWHDALEFYKSDGWQKMCQTTSV